MIRKGLELLRVMGVPYEFELIPAHRSPERVAEWASKAADRGIQILIAASGSGGGLASIAASHTSLPVIGIPLDSSPLRGHDALFSMVQAPAGAPVACVGVNSAENAAILAAQILALKNPQYKKVLAHQKHNYLLRSDSALQEIRNEFPDLASPEITGAADPRAGLTELETDPGPAVRGSMRFEEMKAASDGLGPYFGGRITSPYEPQFPLQPEVDTPQPVEPAAPGAKSDQDKDTEPDWKDAPQSSPKAMGEPARGEPVFGARSKSAPPPPSAPSAPCPPFPPSPPLLLSPLPLASAGVPKPASPSGPTPPATPRPRTPSSPATPSRRRMPDMGGPGPGGTGVPVMQSPGVQGLPEPGSGSAPSMTSANSAASKPPAARGVPPPPSPPSPPSPASQPSPPSRPSAASPSPAASQQPSRSPLPVPGPMAATSRGSRRASLADRLFHIDPDNPNVDVIEHAMLTLLEGGIIGLPTDTVYGIAADATNAQAVARLYQMKSRSSQKAIAILVHNAQMLSRLVTKFPPKFEELQEEFWPGSLTMIFTKPIGALAAVSSAPTIGVRIPDHNAALAVISMSGRPLAVTSANLAGQPPASTAQEVVSAFGEELDCILDAGPSPSPVASTVLSLVQQPYQILREGAISRESLKKVLGDLLQDASA